MGVRRGKAIDANASCRPTRIREDIIINRGFLSSHLARSGELATYSQMNPRGSARCGRTIASVSIALHAAAVLKAPGGNFVVGIHSIGWDAALVRVWFGGSCPIPSLLKTQRVGLTGSFECSAGICGLLHFFGILCLC